MIHLNASYSIIFSLGCGSSTNTRAELLALWDLLYIAKEIRMPYLHVFGDSSVVINREKEVSSLSIMSLEAWCVNIRKLIASFSSVDFKHVYREHNERADSLSKEGLKLVSGHLTFTEFSEGEVSRELALQHFYSFALLSYGLPVPFE